MQRRIYLDKHLSRKYFGAHMNCKTHSEHDHKHGANCGHKAVQHEDHTCYLHDGHMHHNHEGHVDEHSLSGTTNKTTCTPQHKCDSHEQMHAHSKSCGHEMVPHEGHMDY